MTVLAVAEQGDPGRSERFVPGASRRSPSKLASVSEPAGQLPLMDLSAPAPAPAQRPAARGGRRAAAMRPTGEQERIVDAVRDGRDVVVQARAGTGKTATLVLATRAIPNVRSLYLAYNKAIAVDARRRFGRHVDCRTLHSLAFARSHPFMRERLQTPRQNGRMVAQILGITRPLLIDRGSFEMPVDARLTAHHLGRLAVETVKRFCYCADDELAWWQVPRQQGLTDDAQRHLAEHLLPYAHRAWDDIRSPQGLLRYEHDYYLKLWAAGDPQLPYELVLLDEAQDSNRLTSRLIAAQDMTQTVIVGDDCQQLYAWRGASNAMDQFPGHELHYLTQSWRFGEEIAEMGNVFLRIRGAAPLVRGNPQLPSRVVSDMPEPDAILCRSNGGAMEEVIKQLDAGRPVYLQGGGESIKRMAEAAQELALGYGTNNPDLCAFTTWAEVLDYVDRDPGGQDLRAFVRLVEDHGAQAIIDACEKLVNPALAYGERPARGEPAVPPGAVVVSTLHRSKGLEWDRVRIGNDVPEPHVDMETWDIRVDSAEMMLNYVGATRAKLELDPGPLRQWQAAEADIRAQ